MSVSILLLSYQRRSVLLNLRLAFSLNYAVLLTWGFLWVLYLRVQSYFRRLIELWLGRKLLDVCLIEIRASWWLDKASQLLLWMNCLGHRVTICLINYERFHKAQVLLALWQSMGFYVLFASTVLLFSTHEKSHQLLTVLNGLIVVLASTSFMSQCSLTHSLPTRCYISHAWIDRRLYICWLLNRHAPRFWWWSVLFIHLVNDVLVLTSWSLASLIIDTLTKAVVNDESWLVHI